MGKAVARADGLARVGGWASIQGGGAAALLWLDGAS